MNSPAISAILFDKDGTLFDFAATWNGWAANMISRLSEGDPARAQAIATALHFDLARTAFEPDSPVIAGSGAEVARLIAGALAKSDTQAIEEILSEEAETAPLAEPVPLAPLMLRLRRSGLKIGVATNDSEAAARSHLSRAGIDETLHFIAGYDSGHGAKPDPCPLLAFADAMGLPPSACAMVGDSTHDLAAAKAAGFRAVGVLTGPARAAELAPFAEVVFPDIGHLEDWLARQRPPSPL